LNLEGRNYDDRYLNGFEDPFEDKDHAHCQDHEHYDKAIGVFRLPVTLVFLRVKDVKTVKYPNELKDLTESLSDRYFLKLRYCGRHQRHLVCGLDHRKSLEIPFYDEELTGSDYHIKKHLVR
jgi:hypothetical protein